MRTLNRLCEALLSCGTLMCGARAHAQIDTAIVRQLVSEVAPLPSRETALWGRPSPSPFLFVHAESRAVVATAPDSAGLLHPTGAYWTGQIGTDVAVYNGSIRWAGRRWTMLSWPLSRARYDRLRLIGHERFHSLQAELDLLTSNAENIHLDDFAGRYWLRLEWRALQHALTNSGTARRKFVREALLFRATRRSSDSKAAAGENALEINEGLAEYTGMMTAIPAAARVGWALKLLDTHDANAATGTVVRNFAYASGPAYGILLDDASPGWRQRVRKDSDLGEMLGATLRVQVQRPVDGAAVAALAYGGDLLEREERARQQRREADQARLRALLVSGPTLELEASPQFALSFDPNEVVPMPGVGTAYSNSRATDHWGILTVTSSPLLVMRDSPPLRVRVSAPPGGTTLDSTRRLVRGPGWELALDAGWEYTPASSGVAATVRRR